MTMRIAVISDVHANLPALEAVLEALVADRHDLLVCLGDLVGYNADPEPSVRLLLERADVVVAGNHDRDLSREQPASGTHSVARLVQRWTRDELSDESLRAIEALPPIHTTDIFTAVHGCYLNRIHVTGYVTPTMLGPNLHAVAAEETWGKVAFCGHTHVPMVGWLEADVHHERDPRCARWPSTARAILVNPGAVGQPRDGDPRASYAIVDTEAREAGIRRIAYDVERAARAIRDAGLPDELAARLSEGV